MEIKNLTKGKVIYLEGIPHHACLPTNYCLWKRGLDVSPKCIRCMKKYETIDHALCGCKRSRKIYDHIFPCIDNKLRLQTNWLTVLFS